MKFEPRDKLSVTVTHDPEKVEDREQDTSKMMKLLVQKFRLNRHHIIIFHFCFSLQTTEHIWLGS